MIASGSPPFIALAECSARARPREACGSCRDLGVARRPAGLRPRRPPFRRACGSPRRAARRWARASADVSACRPRQRDCCRVRVAGRAASAPHRTCRTSRAQATAAVSGSLQRRHRRRDRGRDSPPCPKGTFLRADQRSRTAASSAHSRLARAARADRSAPRRAARLLDRHVGRGSSTRARGTHVLDRRLAIGDRADDLRFTTRALPLTPSSAPPPRASPRRGAPDARAVAPGARRAARWRRRGARSRRASPIRSTPSSASGAAGLHGLLMTRARARTSRVALRVAGFGVADAADRCRARPSPPRSPLTPGSPDEVRRGRRRVAARARVDELQRTRFSGACMHADGHGRREGACGYERGCDRASRRPISAGIAAVACAARAGRESVMASLRHRRIFEPFPTVAP